jgi:hypothetical protein
MGDGATPYDVGNSGSRLGQDRWIDRVGKNTLLQGTPLTTPKNDARYDLMKLAMDKQLVNFITCGCESSASFFVIYKAGREPMPYW